MRAENNPEKIGKWNDLAQELKSKTDVVDALIDSIRYELWKAGGPTVDGKSLEIKIIHSDGLSDIISCNHTYNDTQTKWFRAGSALNLIRSKQ